MMTIRCRTTFSALLFCLPLGLCIASTVYAADDDDDEWRETKGPRSERSHADDAEGDGKPAKSSGDEAKKSDDSDKSSDAASSESQASDDDQGTNKPRRRSKSKPKASSKPANISLALLGSYGFPDSMRPGLGLRGGVHIDTVVPLYVGGMGQYFFGSGTSRKDVGDRIENSRNFMLLGAEGGIDVEATTDVLLRPMLGLGLGVHRYKHCSSADDACFSDTTFHPVISPGIVGLYSLGDFFFGLDFRYVIVPGRSEASGPVISVTAGLKF